MVSVDPATVQRGRRGLPRLHPTSDEQVPQAMNNPSGQLRQLATPLRETVRGVLQTTWSNREALMALRKSAEPPAALALLDRLGAEHLHAVFTVELNVSVTRVGVPE